MHVCLKWGLSNDHYRASLYLDADFVTLVLYYVEGLEAWAKVENHFGWENSRC